jgi:DNA invertase Pin-like site-specific DNA recombinase
MSPKPTKPVDVYVRVSRVGKRKGNSFISPDEQEQKARRLAADREVAVGKVLTDLDQSGGTLDRPGLQEALARVRAGTSGGIVVGWLDRLSRDTEGSRLLRDIAEAGGVVYADDIQPDLQTASGELMVDIWFAFAKYVRKQSRERFEGAKESAIERGVPVMTRAPIGYRKREDRRLESDPKAAPVVREAFEMAASGQGPSAVARLFESRGLASTQGSRSWTRQAAASVIRNRVYLGELAYGKDRRFVNETAHPAIVDLGTWQAAQRAKRAPAPPRSANPSFLCSSVLRCRSCGYVMVATTNGHGVRSYRCARQHPGGDCPTGMSIAASKIEPLAEAAFWALTADLRAKATRRPDDRVARLQGSAEAAQQRLTQALSPDVQDAAGDGWAEMVRNRRDERDQALAALTDAKTSVLDSELPDEATLRQAWGAATVTERRELLAARLDCIALRRNGHVEATVWPKGTITFELPYRGYKREPRLCPFPAEVPGNVRTLAL